MGYIQLSSDSAVFYNTDNNVNIFIIMSYVDYLIFLIW